MDKSVMKLDVVPPKLFEPEHHRQMKRCKSSEPNLNPVGLNSRLFSKECLFYTHTIHGTGIST